MACGYRMYSHLRQLTTWAGRVVVINLLSGTATVDGADLSPGLSLGNEAAQWMGERLERDGVPEGG